MISTAVFWVEELRIVVPGDPVAQGRGKVGRWRARDGRSGITVRDPGKSRSWKAYAQAIYAQTLASTSHPLTPFGAVPLRVDLACIFRCPSSDHRKRDPVPRRWKSGGNLDVDNLAKAALDAGNGVLWIDDGQVVDLRVRKVIGAQGEPSRVEMTITPAGPPPVGEGSPE